jgi:rhodanese-related sulfurtransferase
MKRIQPTEIPSDAVLIDIRDDLEAAASPLEALSDGRPVMHVSLHDLEEGQTPALPQNAPVVVICGNGSKGELGGAFLEAAGATVSVLDGGYRAWKRIVDGEKRLELRTVGVNGIRQALELQGKLERVPGVRSAGVSADGLVVVHGTVTLEGLNAALGGTAYRLETE